jgi:hypothetical protein
MPAPTVDRRDPQFTALSRCSVSEVINAHLVDSGTINRRKNGGEIRTRPFAQLNENLCSIA